MNRLELSNIKEIEISEIESVKATHFKWGQREIIITDKNNQTFKIILHTELLDKNSKKSVDLNNITLKTK
jgi:hypothetical protein